jgi:mediator of RNA polymerase II transcription subunit 14
MAATELAIRPRMNDLPDEIVHITEGFIPLSRLLTRLVQSTHNALQAKVVELANLPLPSSAMNGNGVNGNHAPDDVTVENLKKKSIMLNFLQDMHTQWVKAYVIADWSRRADMASKLIDLKFHLDQQRHKYDMALDHSIHMKQNLAYAQLRSPDIKTGYQILATGCASFMPDLNYIEPPALPSNELLECVTELNTSLSLRLNVDEYDKIPPQFRDYTIASGRVTFSVKGEFEVDLTIADEDPAKQFWFIDFRFAFAPTAQEIPDSIRIYLEFLANNALAENGLAGCYQFLHEFVLSHKINELKRQALQLNRGLWDLKVEPLQRALAIQYWTSRSSQTDQMPKHWIMIGVNSDHVHAPADLVFTSSLVLKWYRDGQEVRDANIPMDLENLSVEDILMAVVGKHTHHILSTLHARFSAAPGFKETPSRELLLSPPETDPKDMSFSIPVGVESRVTLSVEPITGALHLEPHSRLLQAEERRLNMSKTPIEDAMMCLEQSRWRMLADIFARKAACCEWAYTKPPLTNEIIKSQVRIRERQCTLFFQRQGWRPDWYIMMLLCPAGDSCWAVQVSHGQGSFVRLALDISHTDPGASFWGNLDVLATGVMTQAIIRRSMLQRGANIKADESVVEAVPGLPQKMPVPVVLAKLSDLIPTLSSKMGTAGFGH